MPSCNINFQGRINKMLIDEVSAIQVELTDEYKSHFRSKIDYIQELLIVLSEDENARKYMRELIAASIVVL